MKRLILGGSEVIYAMTILAHIDCIAQGGLLTASLQSFRTILHTQGRVQNDGGLIGGTLQRAVPGLR